MSENSEQKEFLHLINIIIEKHGEIVFCIFGHTIRFTRNKVIRCMEVRSENFAKDTISSTNVLNMKIKSVYMDVKITFFYVILFVIPSTALHITECV
jgi:hypothetical protein